MPFKVISQVRDGRNAFYRETWVVRDGPGRQRARDAGRICSPDLIDIYFGTKGDFLSTRAIASPEGHAHEETVCIDFPDERREQILNHLDEILRSPLFVSSKRYCSLLRYIVEQTVEGRAEQLKERTIGVEAFGRAADYDTNADHSVRSVAGEVRRRLALFYAEPGSENGVKIELHSGSYVPQIRFPVPSSECERSVEPPPSIVEKAAPAKGWTTRRAAFPVAVAALLLSAISLRPAWQQRNSFDEFWNPILSSPNQALLCVGGGRSAASTDGVVPTLAEFDRTPARRMNVSDAMALVSLTGALESKKKTYRILNRAGNTSFKELQQGPFILIGGMNNEWTLRLTSGLRYSFVRTTPGARIADKHNPANTSWSFNYASPIDQPVRDYAIITRLHDAMTDQPGVIVAGIGSWGTQAAAEFVSNPVYVRKLASMGPSDWTSRNLQVVIATDVIHGSSGPPIVLGAHFW